MTFRKPAPIQPARLQRWLGAKPAPDFLFTGKPEPQDPTLWVIWKNGEERRFKNEYLQWLDELSEALYDWSKRSWWVMRLLFGWNMAAVTTDFIIVMITHAHCPHLQEAWRVWLIVFHAAMCCYMAYVMGWLYPTRWKPERREQE